MRTIFLKWPCFYTKDPTQSYGSFAHPKHMFKLMDKKIILKKYALTKLAYLALKCKIFRSKFCLSRPIYYHMSWVMNIHYIFP